jgi:membrane-associated phospholipid phosphatase
MPISDKTYLGWQRKRAAKKWYRRFWDFWALYSVVLFFAAGGVLLYMHKWAEVAAALIAFGVVRLVVSPLIYIFYKKFRPYQRLEFRTSYWFLFSRYSTKPDSFPSDHGAACSAITAVFFYYFPVLGVAFMLITFLNGCARVILGYHYPIDILGGWLLGIFSAIFAVHVLVPMLFTR